MSVRGGEIVRADVGIPEKQPQILGDQMEVEMEEVAYLGLCYM